MKSIKIIINSKKMEGGGDRGGAGTGGGNTDGTYSSWGCCSGTVAWLVHPCILQAIFLDPEINSVVTSFVTYLWEFMGMFCRCICITGLNNQQWLLWACGLVGLSLVTTVWWWWYVFFSSYHIRGEMCTSDRLMGITWWWWLQELNWRLLSGWS